MTIFQSTYTVQTHILIKTVIGFYNWIEGVVVRYVIFDNVYSIMLSQNCLQISNLTPKFPLSITIFRYMV
jgi:hypothetical protein